MPKRKAKNKSAEPVVPFVRGFKPPAAAEVKRALGKVDDDAVTPFMEDVREPFFRPLPQPTCQDDWLAQYNEEGQTFAEFLDINPWLSQRRRKYLKQTFNKSGTNIVEKYPEGKIYLLPLGSFDDSQSCRFDDLVEYTQTFFGSIPVVQLNPVNLEFIGSRVHWSGTVSADSDDCYIVDEALSPSAKRRRTPSGSQEQSSRKPPRHYLPSRCHTTKDGRNTYQLKADGILEKLRQNIPDDALCLVALTMADLFDTKPDLFVAGLADGRNRVAVFSFYRYHPNLRLSTEFWYDTWLEGALPTAECVKLLLLRSSRLLVHELGHLLAVDHCIFYACCMNGSGHLQEDFSQPMHLCPVDLRKLQTLCGFDILDRYKKLAAFFRRHGFEDEMRWVDRRIEFIETKGQGRISL